METKALIPIDKRMIRPQKIVDERVTQRLPFVNPYNPRVMQTLSKYTDDELDMVRGLLQKESNVYAIYQGADDESDIRALGYVKIGLSNSPEARFSSIQTSNPYDLKFLGSIPGDYKLEQRIHCALSNYHVRGEWFRYQRLARNIAEAIENFDLMFVYNVLINKEIKF